VFCTPTKVRTKLKEKGDGHFCGCVCTVFGALQSTIVGWKHTSACQS